MVSYLERSVNSTCVPDPAYLDSVSRPVSRNWNRYVFAFFLVLLEDTEFCKHTVRSRLPRQRHLRTDAFVGVSDWPRFPSLNQSLKILLNKHLCSGLSKVLLGDKTLFLFACYKTFPLGETNISIHLYLCQYRPRATLRATRVCIGSQTEPARSSFVPHSLCRESQTIAADKKKIFCFLTQRLKNSLCGSHSRRVCALGPQGTKATRH